MNHVRQVDNSIGIEVSFRAGRNRLAVVAGDSGQVAAVDGTAAIPIEVFAGDLRRIGPHAQRHRVHVTCGRAEWIIVDKDELERIVAEEVAIGCVRE